MSKVESSRKRMTPREKKTKDAQKKNKSRDRKVKKYNDWKKERRSIQNRLEEAMKEYENLEEGDLLFED